MTEFKIVKRIKKTGSAIFAILNLKSRSVKLWTHSFVAQSLS